MAESSIVLVHGSFFSSWTWLPVIERLHTHDVDVTAIELPLTSLAADADVLRGAIAEASKTKGIGAVMAYGVESTEQPKGSEIVKVYTPGVSPVAFNPDPPPFDQE